MCLWGRGVYNLEGREIEEESLLSPAVGERGILVSDRRENLSSGGGRYRSSSVVSRAVYLEYVERGRVVEYMSPEGGEEVARNHRSEGDVPGSQCNSLLWYECRCAILALKVF